MEIRNKTPFLAGLTVRLDVDGGERLAVAVRAIWRIDGNGSLKMARKQPPLLAADTFFGDPGASSIRYEADLGPAKVATDVALVGSAFAPKRGMSEYPIALRAGPLLQRALVRGDAYPPSAASPNPSGSAKHVDRVPLLWELAAGGADASPDDEQHHGIDLRNPLGRGFRAKHSKRESNSEAAPQIVSYEGDQSVPVGFGFIGPHWLPRQQFAGTYDDVWRNERCPLLPEDFDSRYFNSAAPGLTAPGFLTGGEAVEVYGCTAGGFLSFNIPQVHPAVDAMIGRSKEPVPMSLNTVTVNTDAMRLRLCWRGEIGIHKRLPRLRYVDIREAELAR